MKLENDTKRICQVINFIEDKALFACREPIKYQVKYEILGIETYACQKHYEYFKDEVERNEMSEIIKFIVVDENNSVK
jgi:hypothetical protein